MVFFKCNDISLCYEKATVLLSKLSSKQTSVEIPLCGMKCLLNSFLVSKTTFSLFIDLQQSYKCMATKIDELNFHVSRYKVLFFLLLQSKMKWGGNCLFYSVISNIYHS